jgi:hypothetical protein
MSQDADPAPPRGSGAPALVAAGLVVTGLATCGVVFSLRTATSGWAFPWFLAVWWAVVHAPGSALVAATGLRLRGLDAALLASLVGVLAGSGLYWACGRLDLRELFWLWPALGVVLWLRRHRGWRPRRGWPRPSATWEHAALCGVTLLALVPLALVPIYYGNLARLPQGGLSYQSLPDVIVHLGLARELQHSIPPQIPFLPGVALDYHYGVDLVVAMLGSAPGLDVSDLAVRFTPTVFVVLVVLAAFCFARAFLATEKGAVLFAFLVFFGEDLSYVPGWLIGSTEPWTVQFFGVPSIVSLYLLNPMLPALALLFGGLLCLLRACGGEEQRRAWGEVAAVLFAGLVVYKVFAAVQLVASLGVASIVYLWRRRDRRPLLVLLATCALTLPLAVPMAAAGSGRLWVRPGTWPWVPAAVIRAGLHETPFGRAIFAYLDGSPGVLPAAVFWLLALPGYLIGALGLRLVGVTTWLREAVSMREGRAGQFTVAAFVGLGPLLALTWVITPKGYPPLQTYNEAVWFFAQSKYVAWIFAVQLLCGILGPRPRWLRLLGAPLLLLLAVPSSVQYLVYQVRNTTSRSLSADEVGAIEDLERRSAPGDVVIAERELAGAVVTLTHCRARVHGVFAWGALAPAEEQRHRFEELEFWTAWRGGLLRRDLLRRQGARFVLVESAPAPPDLAPAAVHGLVRLYELAVPPEARGR